MSVYDIGARSDDGRGWLPWLLMLPSLGGCLASSAVGRRELKWLSLAALSWTPVVYFIAVGFWPAAAGGPSKIRFAGAIGLVLAMVVGVPPLVYLFPKHTRTRFGKQVDGSRLWTIGSWRA